MGVSVLTTQTQAHTCTHTHTSYGRTDAHSLEQLRKSTYKYIAYVVDSEEEMLQETYTGLGG